MSPFCPPEEPPPTRLLAICGSLRQASTNRVLITAFQRHSPSAVRIDIAPDLGVLPPFNPDREGATAPAEVTAFAEQIREAERLIITAPEYAHGIPGVSR